MKREDWRLWIALLAAITFVVIILDAGQKTKIHDRIDDRSIPRTLVSWLKAIDDR